MNAVTITEAKRDLKGLIEKVISDSDPTIICTDVGIKVVVMPLTEYNSWQETNYLLSNPANAEHLSKSIALAKAGKTKERKLVE